VKRAGLLVLLICCSACSTPPKGEAPAAQERLAETEARAAALVRAGDYAGAARKYDEALRIAASVENADAIAANAVNLSIVYQWLDRATDARDALSIVVEDSRRPFPERRRLQAELRRAMLDLALRNNDSAAGWAQRASARCAEGCEYAATILNVQAQIALEAAKADEAAHLAQRAIARARARGDATEAANGLRTLGRSRHAQGDPVAARPLLEQALELDRALADPRKILADLRELSRAAAAAGDRQASRDYAERALAVSRAFNDARGVAEMEAQLRRP
jgi:tetratricopeptide (TPR) repeat protein